MPPATYTGALQPKKKAELQEIAVALGLNDQGTREDLQSRIKKHLDTNSSLEDEPSFAGLFNKRKKSSLPPYSRTTQQVVDSTSVEAADHAVIPAARHSRRGKVLNRVRELTPPSDEPDEPATPSPLKSILEISRREVDGIVRLVKRNEETALRSANELVVSTRAFLSSSLNIWSLTAVLELIYILRMIIPWKTLKLFLSPSATSSSPAITIPYPPFAVFQNTMFWMILAHWALPAIIIPWLVGTLVSFQPNPVSVHTPFDPLSASIVRLAAQLAYPYTTLSVKGVDVLGSRVRVLNAGVGLAFAFAEAIARAPSSTLHEKDAADDGLE